MSDPWIGSDDPRPLYYLNTDQVDPRWSAGPSSASTASPLEPPPGQFSVYSFGGADAARAAYESRGYGVFAEGPAQSQQHSTRSATFAGYQDPYYMQTPRTTAYQQHENVEAAYQPQQVPLVFSDAHLPLPSSTDAPQFASRYDLDMLDTPTESDGEAYRGGPVRTVAAKPRAAPARKRHIASCAPCRQRKTRCSRSKPCTSCVERGDPAGCLWEGDAAPLYIASQENEVVQLQAQVKQLEGLIASIPRQTASTGGAAADSLSSVPTTSRRRMSSQQALEYVLGPDMAQHTKHDLISQDLCGALLVLALSGTVAPPHAGRESFLPSGQSGVEFLQEAKTRIAGNSDASSRLQDTPSPDAYGGVVGIPGVLVTATAPVEALPTMRTILPLLPKEHELRTSFDFYRQHSYYICPTVSRETVRSRWRILLHLLDSQLQDQQLEADDAQFVAMALAVGAIGLASMTDVQARSHGFGSDRVALATRWNRVASMCLQLGKFVEKPSLDGVRAATVISAFHVFLSKGETLPAGLALLSLAANAAIELGLTRDPKHLGAQECSFGQGEERRRVFWSLFTLSTVVSTVTGRIWPQFDLRFIDVALPEDFWDEELEMAERAARARLGAREVGAFQETAMSAAILHYKLAILVKAATDQCFTAAGCEYETILSLDERLIALESTLPDVYVLSSDSRPSLATGELHGTTHQRAIILTLCIAAEMLRLHRPFLALAAFDDRYQYSRAQCVSYATRILRILSSPYRAWIDFSIADIMAAISLAVDLLAEDPQNDAEKRTLVDIALQRMDSLAAVSPAHARSAITLRALLEKKKATARRNY